MIKAAIFAGPFLIGVSGYILKDSPVESLVNSIRVVARDGRAISPELAAIARQAEEDSLTSREREILRLVEQGHPIKAITERLDLSPGTVRNYLSEAASKLGRSSRIATFQEARRRGLL